MNKLIGPRNQTSDKKPYQEELVPIESDDFLSGLITDLDSRNIPANALQGLLNGAYIRNTLLRRNGVSQYSLVKPDANKILNVVCFVTSNRAVIFFRFTVSTIYRVGSGTWLAIAGAALGGNATDYYSFAVADNRFFFANNGAGPIREINVAANTYAPLGNAPNYKFIISAFNRILAANLIAGTNVPYRIGWSGDLNYSEWNPVTDLTAGSADLVNSPSDLSDDITGLFSFESKFCVTRQKSIWFGYNQPSATVPFKIDVAIPKIGCDIPRAISQFADGIFFYNYQYSTVYKYTPDIYGDSLPKDIGIPIKRYLKSLITDPTLVYSSYSFDYHAFSLFIPDSTNPTNVNCFTYYLDTNNWVQQQYQNVTTCSDLDSATSGGTILDLTGIITGLGGIISDLGGINANSTRVFGYSTGDLGVQKAYSGLSTELINQTVQDWNSNFSFVVTSKTISIPVLNEYISKCAVYFTPFNTNGTVTLAYSKDDGVSWVNYKSLTFINADLQRKKFITGSKFINCRNFIWRLTSNDTSLSVDKFVVIVTKPDISKGPISRK